MKTKKNYNFQELSQGPVTTIKVSKVRHDPNSWDKVFKLVPKYTYTPKELNYAWTISAREIFIARAEQEFDKAFDFIVHELRRMEIYLDKDLSVFNNFEFDMFCKELSFSAEEFTVCYLQKVESGL